MIVRVPGSSANLGPGFDVLGIAITRYAEVGVFAGAGMLPARARPADERHPATVAFRRAGGRGDLWVRSALPAGRGLGYSGAMRVGGAVLAHALRVGPDPAALAPHHAEVLALTTELEGHADNVAASLLGGITVAAAGRAVRVPARLDAEVVVWVPAVTTRTEHSRGRLAATVPFADAVFNVGRVALLVAALAAGDDDALRVAVADRLHQDGRLAAVPASRAALDAAWELGALAAWLSGSGPTIAAMCRPGDGARLAAELPPDGRAHVVEIDTIGATLVGV